MQVAHDINWPQLFLINAASSERYSLLQLDIFKETAHFANQPNTLNTVRLPHSTNTNLTKKSYVFTASTKAWITFPFCHPKGIVCQINCTSSESKLKNHPEAYHPHRGLKTLSNMSRLCKYVLCLLLMPN